MFPQAPRLIKDSPIFHIGTGLDYDTITEAYHELRNYTILGGPRFLLSQGEQHIVSEPLDMSYCNWSDFEIDGQGIPIEPVAEVEFDLANVILPRNNTVIKNTKITTVNSLANLFVLDHCNKVTLENTYISGEQLNTTNCFNISFSTLYITENSSVNKCVNGIVGTNSYIFIIDSEVNADDSGIFTGGKVGTGNGILTINSKIIMQRAELFNFINNINIINTNLDFAEDSRTRYATRGLYADGSVVTIGTSAYIGLNVTGLTAIKKTSVSYRDNETATERLRSITANNTGVFYSQDSWVFLDAPIGTMVSNNNITDIIPRNYTVLPDVTIDSAGRGYI